MRVRGLTRRGLLCGVAMELATRALAVSPGIMQTVILGGGPRSLTLPSAFTLALFTADYDATWKAIPNRAAPGGATPVANIMTRDPRETFSTAGGLTADTTWLFNGTGASVTLGYAADLDGTMSAARLMSATTGAGLLQYRNAISLPAGTYTMVMNAKSNTGSTQTVDMSRNSGSTLVGQTITTTMTQIKFEFTLGSTTSCGLYFAKCQAGVTLDISVGNCFLWSGAAATVPADLVHGGHCFIGLHSLDTVSVVSGGLRLGVGQGGHIDLPTNTTSEGTFIAVSRRYQSHNTNGFREQFLSDILADATGGNQSLMWQELGSTWKGQSRVGGQNCESIPALTPDLFADGNIHAFGVTAGSYGSVMYLDDCGIAQNLVSPPASKTTRHWQVGTNNGFQRSHEIFALLYAPVKLSKIDYDKALDYIDQELAKVGKATTPARNYIVCDNDSNTANSWSWAYNMQAGFSKTALVCNDAIGGSMFTGNGAPQLNLGTRLPGILASFPSTAKRRAGRCIAWVCQSGANDLLNVYGNAGTFNTAYRVIIDQVKAAGVKVFIMTVFPQYTPQNYTSFNPLQVTANNTIRTWPGLGAVDGVIDTDAAGLSAAVATDPTYMNAADGIHLTATGHSTYTTPGVVSAINPLLLAP